MKTQITLIVLLFAAVITPAAAQSPEQFAAQEQRIATLEKQNLSLKAAIEAISGRTLAEILTSAAPAVAPADSPASASAMATQSRKDTSALDAALKALKPQIESAEADLAAFDKALKPDPFSDKKGVRMSKADAAKARAIKESALARLKAQESTLRAQILAE